MNRTKQFIPLLCATALVLASACQTPQSPAIADPVLSDSAKQTSEPNAILIEPLPKPEPKPAPPPATKLETEAAANRSVDAKQKIPSKPVQATAPASESVAPVALGPNDTGISVASLSNPNLAEISGLVFTGDNAKRFWIANDGGNEASIFLMSRTGQLNKTVQLKVNNRDWEDLDTYTHNGENYVLVADIGDNLESQSEYSIHFFSESSLLNAKQSAVAPTYSQHFVYDDGSHNSEAMFVDDDQIYLLSKEKLRDGKSVNGGVYQLPILLETSAKLSTAKRIATLGLPPRSVSSRILARMAGFDFEQPTASAIAPAGNALYVLNYRNVIAFKKTGSESWGEALQRPGYRLHTHGLPQAEALGVAANGDIWLMSEKLPAQLWRFPAMQN